MADSTLTKEQKDRFVNAAVKIAYRAFIVGASVGSKAELDNDPRPVEQLCNEEFERHMKVSLHDEIVERVIEALYGKQTN